MPTITLAYNPSAGTGRHARHHIVALLARAGYAVRCLSTKQPGLAAALRMPATMVVAAGGDGTVAKVARLLDGTDTPLAVLPLGTANNIARAFGLGDSVSEVVSDLRAPAWRWVDLIEVTRGRRRETAVESVGIGALAAGALALHLTDKAEDEPRRAILEARRGLAKTLAKAAPIPLLKVNGEDMSGAALFVEALNMPLMGPGLRLCRAAAADDGRLHLVCAEEAHRKSMVEWLRDGAPAHQAPKLRSLGQVRSARLVWSGATSRIDDAFFDPSEKKSRLSLAVKPGRLRLVVPSR